MCVCCACVRACVRARVCVLKFHSRIQYQIYKIYYIKPNTNTFLFGIVEGKMCTQKATSTNIMSPQRATSADIMSHQRATSADIMSPQ